MTIALILTLAGIVLFMLFVYDAEKYGWPWLAAIIFIPYFIWGSIGFELAALAVFGTVAVIFILAILQKVLRKI